MSAQGADESLYSRLQRMSLRFFTNTRVGELMSRLNNDVIGAQNAISNTIVALITNTIQAIATLVVMLSMEWRLTVLSVLIMPLFILAARLLAGRLRDIAREQMNANASMNAMMNETLNIGGALLVKLFGRRNQEVERFQQRAAEVRSRGVDRAMWCALRWVAIASQNPNRGIMAQGSILLRIGLGSRYGKASVLPGFQIINEQIIPAIRISIYKITRA